MRVDKVTNVTNAQNEGANRLPATSTKSPDLKESTVPDRRQESIPTSWKSTKEGHGGLSKSPCQKVQGKTSK